jgi:hypothetical protein
MDEISRNLLVEAVAEYWRRAPWQKLTDEEHFGVRDAQTGFLACCAILGNTSQKPAVAPYLGEEGFTALRRQIASAMDRDEFVYAGDFMFLSYCRPGEVPKSKRKSPVALDPIHDGGQRIIPMAWRKSPRAVARALDDAEAAFLARTLRAIVRLLDSGRLGAKPLLHGEETVVFVLSSDTDGAIAEERIRPKADAALPSPVPLTISPDARRRLQAMKPRGRLAVAWATPAVSVQGEQVRSLMVLDLDKDFMLVAQAFGGPDPLTQAGAHLISAMLGEAPSSSGRPVPLPAELVTDSLEFYQHAKDTLAELGVKILYQEHVPPLEKAKASFNEFMRHRG